MFVSVAVLCFLLQTQDIKLGKYYISCTTQTSILHQLDKQSMKTSIMPFLVASKIKTKTKTSIVDSSCLHPVISA